jgi:hypothetical protein
MKTIMMQFLDELKKDGYNIPLEHYNSMLEIEKEQIMDAAKSCNYIGGATDIEAEEYYNQTYNQNK